MIGDSDDLVGVRVYRAPVFLGGQCGEARPGRSVEPVTGIEPASRPWEGRILPMNYTGEAVAASD